ncbi:MAG: PKD domain-containing protein [Cytophagales bacterium]|nr:PKD domain-containing protein [Cytophagales bacterium]
MRLRFINLIVALLLMLGITSCGGGGGSSSGTTANPPIITSATASTLGPNIGTLVTFTGAATDPANLSLTYSWNFGDGFSNDTGAVVSRIFNVATTYPVKLTVTNSAGFSDSRTLNVTVNSITSTDVIADCSGANCSATISGVSNSYSGSGTGIWRFDNPTSIAVRRDINIQNVAAGKTVTLVFSNGDAKTTAPSAPSLGILATPTASVASPNAVAAQGMQTSNPSERTRGEAEHTHMLQANRTIALNMIRSAAQAPVQAAASPVIRESVAPTAPKPIAEGDTKIWHENAFDKIDYPTTAKVVCPAGTLGRKVIFWVQTSIASSQVQMANLPAYRSQFCGTDNNDGQYAKVAKLLGDVWGPVPAKYSAALIADSDTQKQDVNIVIVRPPSATDWGGYFYSLNNFLTSPSAANSNEALVFFIHADQSINSIQSVLIHELTHMINFYQRGISHNDVHEDWLEETSAMMTQDIFDPDLKTPSGCLPIVCRVRTYAKSGAGISYFNWPTDISGNHYSLGGSFAAFLNRRYGPVIYAQLMTDCYTPTTNTTSFACLDFLIKKNGGTGFADEFSRMGASIFGRIGGTGEPTGYGFPAKRGSITDVGKLVGSYTYTLPSYDNWWTMPDTIGILPATVLTNFPYTTQSYKIDTVASGKTSYVRSNVSVPAKSSLLITIK